MGKSRYLSTTGVDGHFSSPPPHPLPYYMFHRERVLARRLDL